MSLSEFFLFKHQPDIQTPFQASFICLRTAISYFWKPFNACLPLRNLEMPLPRRAVIAVTSATAPLHEGKPTGLFVSEALHPFQVFKAAGFEVDLVSEKGTYVPDWLSLQPNFLDGDDKKQWEDKSGEFRQKLDNMPNVGSIDGKKVG